MSPDDRNVTETFSTKAFAAGKPLLHLGTSIAGSEVRVAGRQVESSSRMAGRYVEDEQGANMFAKSLLLLLLLSGICLAGDNNRYSETKHYNWNLPASAKLEIHLSAADLNVVQGEKDKLDVTVQLHSDDEAYLQGVKTTFDVERSTGVLRINQPGHHGGGTVTVKVPAGTDLMIRSTAGDISVETAGSKDISTTAGDVKVAVGSPKQYADIDVSTHAGDVSGSTCEEPKGWIGKSVHCTGQGKDHIRVHTTAGDIELMEGTSAEL